MHVTNVLGLLGSMVSPEPPSIAGGGSKYFEAYQSYLEAYEKSKVGREGVFDVVREIAAKSSGLTVASLEMGLNRGIVSVGNAAMFSVDAATVATEAAATGLHCVSDVRECTGRAKRRRAARKRAKERELRAFPVGDREVVVENVASGASGSSVSDKPVSGFWNSCSDDIRRQLIESKAQMHIAENRRKALEAGFRSKYLESPQAAVDEAVRLADVADKLTGRVDVSPVYGYAKTVTSGSAESLVKSLPDSVTSYKDFAHRKMEEKLTVAEKKCNEEVQKRVELEKKVANLEKKVSKVDIVEKKNSVPVAKSSAVASSGAKGKAPASAKFQASKSAVDKRVAVPKVNSDVEYRVCMDSKGGSLIPVEKNSGFSPQVIANLAKLKGLTRQEVHIALSPEYDEPELTQRGIDGRPPLLKKRPGESTQEFYLRTVRYNDRWYDANDC